MKVRLATGLEPDAQSLDRGCVKHFLKSKGNYAFGSISCMLTVKQIWTCHMEFALYKFIIISYHITEELLIGAWPLAVHGKRIEYGAWREHKESLAWNKEKQVYGTDDPGICWGGSRILLRGGGCHLPAVFAFLWAAHRGGGRGFVTPPTPLHSLHSPDSPVICMCKEDYLQILD